MDFTPLQRKIGILAGSILLWAVPMCIISPQLYMAGARALSLIVPIVTGIIFFGGLALMAWVFRRSSNG